ncbi:hypothetical protein ACWEPC_52385, partial [Nonomuraea sp. NPDC004297]
MRSSGGVTGTCPAGSGLGSGVGVTAPPAGRAPPHAVSAAEPHATTTGRPSRSRREWARAVLAGAPGRAAAGAGQGRA